jgi:hypothetical protein
VLKGFSKNPFIFYSIFGFNFGKKPFLNPNCQAWPTCRAWPTYRHQPTWSNLTKWLDQTNLPHPLAHLFSFLSPALATGSPRRRRA